MDGVNPGYWFLGSELMPLLSLTVTLDVDPKQAWVGDVIRFSGNVYLGRIWGTTSKVTIKIFKLVDETEEPYKDIPARSIAPGGDYSAQERFPDAGTYVAYAEARRLLLSGKSEKVEFIILPPGAPPIEPPPPYGAIQGYVRDAVTGAGIPNAIVHLNEVEKIRTREDGSYGPRAVTPGTYNAYATASGYNPSPEVTVIIKEEETTIQDFELTPLLEEEAGVIYGFVYDANTMEPIENAHLSVDGYVDETNSRGYYEIMVPPDYYKVVCTALGYFSDTEYVTVGAGERKEVNFYLEPSIAPV